MIKIKRLYYSLKFKIKHLSNLIVRVFSKDNYYVCEECNKIHKRDDKEIRFDDVPSQLMSHRLWYGSVSLDCFITQQTRVTRLLFGIEPPKLLSGHLKKETDNNEQ